MPTCPVCSRSVELLSTDSPEVFLCLNCKAALHTMLQFRPILLAAFAIVAVRLRMVTLVISPKCEPHEDFAVAFCDGRHIVTRSLANRSRSGQTEVSFYS